MKASDIKIGQRVFAQDRIALVVGKPEFYTTKSHLVRIKYENSTRYEYQLTCSLELLPLSEQYKAHGGTHIKPEGDF